jgi:hypothetical protein
MAKPNYWDLLYRQYIQDKARPFMRNQRDRLCATSPPIRWAGATVYAWKTRAGCGRCGKLT